MDLIFDPAIALFAGLDVVPQPSYLAAWSSRVDQHAKVRLMEAWFEQLDRAGLPHDHVSSRSRRQQDILVFLASDVEQRLFRSANAGVTKVQVDPLGSRSAFPIRSSSSFQPSSASLRTRSDCTRGVWLKPMMDVSV